MIDKVKLYKYIDLDVTKFSNKLKLKQRNMVNPDTGEVYDIDCYVCKFNKLFVKFSNKTKKLSIEGRLVNVQEMNNRVFNLDEYIIPIKYEMSEWESVSILDDDDIVPDELRDRLTTWELDYMEFFSKGIEEMIDYINITLSNLLGLEFREIDIRLFKISKIEICFNIWLEKDYVNEYIELFNLIYISSNKKAYENFVLANGKNLNSSFYIKTRSDYKNKVRRNYTINFYNKKNQLEYIKENKGMSVAFEDFTLAEKLLRMEVQFYYKAINKIIVEEGIDNRFSEFLDIDFCFDLLIKKYEYFIGESNNNFYSYSKAKELISNNNKLTAEETKYLLNYIKYRYQYNKKYSNQTQRKYKKMLSKLNIHDYFIPTKWNIEELESPINLIRNKIETNKRLEQEYLNNTYREEALNILGFY